MKKNFFYVLCFVFFFACSKKEIIDLGDFSGTNTIELLSNTKGMTYIGTVQVGHSSAGCTGCVDVGGTCMHVDCLGAGTACSSRIAMEITAEGDTCYYYATILNPDEFSCYNFFLMPNRSLYIKDSKGQFLNIPEQMAYKDEETGTFTFYDVFFSDRQVFENK